MQKEVILILISFLFLTACSPSRPEEPVASPLPISEPAPSPPVIGNAAEEIVPEVDDKVVEEIPAPLPITPGMQQEVSTTLTFDHPPARIDPFHDPHGPFFHNLKKATSSNGLDFTKVPGVVFEKASVPDALRRSDGRIFLYAVDGAGRSKSGIMVAISEDNGQSWKTGSLQLSCSRPVCSGADSQIVELPDGKLRLYYVVFPERRRAPEQQVNQIRSALSTDGIHFMEEEGIRFEHQQITDPDVVLIGNKWYMYLSQGPRLIAASSLNGLQFKLEKTVREQGSVSKTVSLGHNKWRQFFCDIEIKSATSSDGLHWTPEPGSRLEPEVNEIICDPTPLRMDSGWLLLYKTAPMMGR